MNSNKSSGKSCLKQTEDSKTAATNNIYPFVMRNIETKGKNTLGKIKIQATLFV